MTEAPRHEFPIVLDHPRVLRFDDAALIKARDECGLDVANLMTQKQSLHNLRVLVYCGLQHENSPLTFKQVKKLVTWYRAARLWESVARALVLGRGKTFNNEAQHG